MKNRFIARRCLAFSGVETLRPGLATTLPLGAKGLPLLFYHQTFFFFFFFFVFFFGLLARKKEEKTQPIIRTFLLHTSIRSRKKKRREKETDSCHTHYPRLSLSLSHTTHKTERRDKIITQQYRKRNVIHYRVYLAEMAES